MSFHVDLGGYFTCGPLQGIEAATHTVQELRDAPEAKGVDLRPEVKGSFRWGVEKEWSLYGWLSKLWSLFGSLVDCIRAVEGL